MRKFLLLFCLFLISSVGVQAISSVELTALAAYYGDDSLFFAAMRTDDAFLQQVDTLLLKASEALMPERPPITTTDLLDNFAQTMMNTSFEESIQTWLGSTIAVGMSGDISLMGAASHFPGYVAISITDKDAVIESLEAVLEEAFDDYDISEENNFTVYAAAATSDPSFAVGDDVLLIATQPTLFPLNPIQAPLSESADFVETAAQLPQSDYSALVYANLPAVQALNAELAESMGQNMPASLQAFNQLSSSQVWGFAILDETTLVMDIATRVNPDAWSALGITPYTPSAVSLDFAQNIPSDAAFVLQSSDFGAAAQSGLDNIRALGAYIAENGGFANLLGLPEGMLRREERAALNLITPGSFLAVFNISFAGLTGLSLERDVLPVLDGDAAMVLRVLPAPRRFPLPTPFLPDMALLFQSSDETGAQMLLDALIAASEAYDTGYQVEAYGEEGAALVAPLLSQATRSDLTMLDFMVAANGEIFALGTRPAVESIIHAETHLTDTAEFQAASAYFLPESQSIAYITFAPIGNLIATSILENTLPRAALRDTGTMLRIAGLIQSATISTRIAKDGQSLARLTITLWAEPAPFMPED